MMDAGVKDLPHSLNSLILDGVMPGSFDLTWNDICRKYKFILVSNVNFVLAWEYKRESNFSKLFSVMFKFDFKAFYLKVHVPN
jgi:hypothetical protein